MEREEKGKDFYASERRYGSFVHTVPLLPGLDLDRATARVENGVLTVTSRRSRRAPAPIVSGSSHEANSPQAPAHGRVAWIRRTAWGR